MILFYNIVYAYVCKTSEERFGGCWRSFSWLGRKVHVIVDTSRESMPSLCLVVSLLVISISLWSSPPRTSGMSDNTGLCPCYFRQTKNQKIRTIIYALL